MNKIDYRILGIFGIFVSIALLSMMLVSVSSFDNGVETGVETVKNAAVKVGAAHYESDNDGKPIFVWNNHSTNKVEK